MKNSESFSVLCWANRAKADVNGLLPVYARVTVMGKRAEISLKKKVSPEQWDAKSGFIIGNSNDTRLFNKHLISVNNDLHAIYMDFKQRGLHLTAEEVKNKYLGIEAIRRSLLEVFDEHNKSVEELVGKDFVKGTHTKYETIRTKVAEFIAYKYKKQDLYLDTLEYSFITAFEHYLKVHDNISHNVVMSYIKRVKRIINIAVHNRWIAFNPFTAFVCTTKKTTRTELEEDELTALEEKKFAIARLEEVKDCYLFSCYTGYAFVDAFKLTPEHLVAGKDGEMWVNTSRTKSKIEANVPLLPKAIAIINKYKGHPVCLANNKILPMKSNQKMNAYLKEIADLCGISKNLTTHTARHTFATTVTLENDVPIESVSKMLGHTKITTTQLYARVKEKKVSRDMKSLKTRIGKCSDAA
ncbi:MAG TPA: site-specific integrase [Mucilaginibacter sp.]|jgi:site-specific recombinase XerD|nr:site-specific integrase [Mucilaginibacter sp.]